MAKKKALTAAERQRRCWEKRKNDPEKVAEVKRKDLERYHTRKKLVVDMTVREHRIMKRKWQQSNKKRKEKKQMLENVMLNTPAPSPIPEDQGMRSYSATPNNSEVSSSRGRKRVKRDRSKLYRENIKLQDKIETLQKKVQKYKKRLHRKSKKYSNSNDENNSKNKNKYSVFSNAIKERYQTVNSRKEKRLIQSLLQTRVTKESRMQTQLIRDTLGVDRPLRYKSILPQKNDLVNDNFMIPCMAQMNHLMKISQWPLIKTIIPLIQLPFLVLLMKHFTLRTFIQGIYKTVYMYSLR